MSDSSEFLCRIIFFTNIGRSDFDHFSNILVRNRKDDYLYLANQDEINQFRTKYQSLPKSTDWASKIQSVIENLNRDIAAIAQEVSYPEVNVIRVMRGSSIPSVTMLLNFVRYLHVNASWLLDESDGPVLTDTLRARDSSEEIARRIKSLKSAKPNHKVPYNTILYYTKLRDRRNYTDLIKESSIRKIAGSYQVGLDWLLCGDNLCKDDPINDQMISFLWRREDLRETIWLQMPGKLPYEFHYATGNNEKGRETSDKAASSRLLDGKASPTEGTFAERLHERRKELKMSLKALADYADLSYATLQRWEKGIIIPDDLTISRLADKLEVGTEWLKGGSENRKYYPCEKQMIEYLKSNPALRYVIANKAEAASTFDEKNKRSFDN